MLSESGPLLFYLKAFHIIAHDLRLVERQSSSDDADSQQSRRSKVFSNRQLVGHHKSGIYLLRNYYAIFLLE